MTELERESLVARQLADYRDRQSRGEIPRAEDYSEGLGDSYVDFLEVLRMEEVLGDVLDPQPEPALPREFGPYVLLRELGRGAAGIVYEAVHRRLGRREAVKVLRTGFEESGSALKRFQHEAQALASIEHDHVVTVHDADEVDGRAYYAMELVEGSTLLDLIRDPETRDPRELSRGLAGVADALHALHEAGVCHRDVKPSNIMVDTNAGGRMVLADFGLARSVSSASLTRTGQALGTPLYMSPEQMRGRRDEVDGRSDVYGLGATMYHLFAGEPVFPDTGDVRVLFNRVLNERPLPLRKVAPDLPSDLDHIVLTALEKRQEDRHQSADELRNELLNFANGLPITRRPIPKIRHAARRARPLLLPLAALLLAAIGVSAYLSRLPGVVHANTMPRAAIVIDGQDYGTTPRTLELAPGVHSVVLECDHFIPHREELDLEAGAELPFSPPLVPKKDEEHLAMAVLQRDLLNLRDQRTFTPTQTTRSAGSAESATLLPQGNVRVEDLDRFVFYVPLDAPDAGHIEFRRKGGELIHRQPFGPTDMVTIEAIPAEVRAALKAGDEVTWGYVGDDGEAYLATFRVAPHSMEFERELTELDARTAHLPSDLRMLLRGLLFLERDLPMAAYRLGLADRKKADEADASILPWGLMREALIRLELGRSSAAADARYQISGFPEEVREAWFGD